MVKFNFYTGKGRQKVTRCNFQQLSCHEISAWKKNKMNNIPKFIVYTDLATMFTAK